MPFQDFTFDNSPPDSNPVPDGSMTNDPPSANPVGGVSFDDGPSWGINDLAGQSLEQYSKDGVLLNTYVIVSNTAIDTGGNLTIDVGEDWDPWQGVNFGTYWIVEDPNLLEKFLLKDTGLGSGGPPYEGTFIRKGRFTSARDLGQSMTANPPDANPVAGVSMVNADPTSRDLSQSMDDTPPDANPVASAAMVNADPTSRDLSQSMTGAAPSSLKKYLQTDYFFEGEAYDDDGNTVIGNILDSSEDGSELLLRHVSGPGTGLNFGDTVYLRSGDGKAWKTTFVSETETSPSAWDFRVSKSLQEVSFVNSLPTSRVFAGDQMTGAAPDANPVASAAMTGDAPDQRDLSQPMINADPTSKDLSNPMSNAAPGSKDFSSPMDNDPPGAINPLPTPVDVIEDAWGNAILEA